MKEIKVREPEVEISELPYDPRDPNWGATEATVYSAKISHDKEGRSPKDIWRSEREELSQGELEEEQRDFLERLANLGHASCFYQADVGINLQIPRYESCIFCEPDFSKNLQQSQRYTRARDFFSRCDGSEEIYSKQADLYDEMIEDGIKKEDARYVLPLGTSATHLHHNTNFAGLANLHRLTESETSKMPEMTRELLDEIIDKLNERDPVLFDRELIDIYNSSGNGYPVANMFSKGNRWVDETVELLDDEDVVKPFVRPMNSELLGRARDLEDQAATFLNLSNSLRSVEGYTSKMSLSAWHQFMRNDTVKQSVESIYDAVERGEIVVPESIDESGYSEDYVDLCDESLELYESLSREHGKEEAVEVLPHGMNIGVAFSLDGFNLTKGFMEDRTSQAAQWEIREVAKNLEKFRD